MPRFRKLSSRRVAFAVLLGLAMIGIASGAWLARGKLDEIHAVVSGWNSWAIFAAMALLPVTGFSVSVVYLLAGAHFETGPAIAVVTPSSVSAQEKIVAALTV